MLRRTFSFLMIGVLTFSPFGEVFVYADTAPSEPVAQSIIVKFNDPAAVVTEQPTDLAADSFEQKTDTTVIDSVPTAGLSLVVPDDGASIADSIQKIEADPTVAYAEPNYSRSIQSLSLNDQYAGLQWALENTGQSILGTSGVSGDDVKAASAWNISEGSPVIVAVIDIGVDYTHPDIADSMWDGSSCKDENGVVIVGGCIHGYDFENNDNDPMPSVSNIGFHGSHVAGIIAAEKNNHIGVAGIAPNAKIMALRFGLDVISEVRAIDFARQNGAKIINASYGGSDYSQAEHDAIKRFEDAGGLFVAAAGNNASSNDSVHVYPSDHDLASVVSVAATTNKDELASFSDYGSTFVDVGAPGTSIVSLALNHSYAYSDGTSMASPYAAGLAALIWGYNPTLTAAQVKSVLLNSGDSLPALVGKTVSGNRINAASALATFAPKVGYSGDNVLSAAAINDRNDGSGSIDIPFYIKDGLTGASTTLSSFVFSMDGGATWHAPLGGDNSSALANGWKDAHLSAAAYASAAPYSFSFDTDSPDVLGVLGTSSATSTLRIGFKVWDGATTSPYAYSDDIIFDRTPPTAVLSQTPAASSTDSSIDIIVGGADVLYYKYSLDHAVWSVETSTATHITLAGLLNGDHHLEVIGEDRAHNWQDAASSTAVDWNIAVPIVPAPPAPSTPVVDQGAVSGGGGGGVSSPAPVVTNLTSNSGDTNHDSKVDILDFNTLMIHWGEHTSLGDTNGDGVIDILDFNSVMVHWKP